jgi:hypothetical protein
LVRRLRKVAAAANIVARMVVATLTNAWSWRPVRSLLPHRSEWFAGQDFVGTRGGTAAGPTKSVKRAIERKWVMLPDGQINDLPVQPLQQKDFRSLLTQITSISTAIPSS